MSYLNNIIYKTSVNKLYGGKKQKIKRRPKIMSFLKNPLNTTVEDFEANREEIMNKFNEGIEYMSDFENDLEIADTVEDDCLSFEFLSKLENLDSVAFIQVDVMNKNNSNQLFGEISKAVAEAIDSEVEDITKTTEKNAAVQATPNTLRNNYAIKKKRVIDEMLLNVGEETYDQTMMTIRCMDIYSEMSQTTDAISERTRRKMEEHQRLMLFIGVVPTPNASMSEAQLGEVVSYTIAVVSNIKDGTVPDINRYKEKVVDAINNSTNRVIDSADVKATLKSFSDVSETLANCKEQISNTPQGKNFVNAISAIENICNNQKDKTL